MFFKYTFELNEVEQQRKEYFLENHKCEYYPIQYEIGGAIGYKFIPNSIGQISKIFCSCGEEVDLTDMDIW